MSARLTDHLGEPRYSLSLSGAWIVDPLNHYFGRRGEIFITACCLTATPIGSGFAKSWQGLFAARFVLGIGIGKTWKDTNLTLHLTLRL